MAENLAWLTQKAEESKKVAPPPPPTFLAKFLIFPKWLNFWKILPPPPTPFNKGGRSSNYAESEIPSINLTNAVKFLISTVNPTI